MQHAETVPTVLDRAEFDGGLGRERSDRRAVCSRESTGTDQYEWTLRLTHHISKAVAPNVGERFRPAAEIIVGVGERRLGANNADRKNFLPCANACECAR